MYGKEHRTASPDRHRIRFSSSGLVAPSPSTSTATTTGSIVAAVEDRGRPPPSSSSADGRQQNGSAAATNDGEGGGWTWKKGEDAAERGQNGHHHDMGRKGDSYRAGGMNGHTAGGGERAEVVWHLLGGLRREIKLGARRGLRLLDGLRPRSLPRSPTSAGRLLTSSAPDGDHPLSKRGTHIVLLLAAAICLYLLVIALLDGPTSLRLDPTIDPRTFQLLPQDWGDPTGRIKRDQRDEPLFVALQAERQRIWRERGVADADQTAGGWYRGDQALRDNRPASRFLCDDGRGDRPEGSLIFLGIFTTPSALAKRQLLRTLFKPDLPPVRDGRPALIDVAFIAARPPNDDWRYVLEKEKARYGDIEWFDSVPENIDTGKTAHFLQWVATGAGGRWDVNVTGETTGRRRARPQFVMKLDDDGFLAVPNVVKEFTALDCRKNVYWGTAQGSTPKLGVYFRGMAYALSWPLVEWIGTAGMSPASAIGVEDARVGAWLTDLDPVEDPVQRVDVGWRMGDWDQMDIDENTVGLHWLKLDHWVPMVKRKVLGAWERAGWEYRWDWHLDHR